LRIAALKDAGEDVGVLAKGAGDEVLAEQVRFKRAPERGCGVQLGRPAREVSHAFAVDAPQVGQQPQHVLGAALIGWRRQGAERHDAPAQHRARPRCVAAALPVGVLVSDELFEQFAAAARHRVAMDREVRRDHDHQRTREHAALQDLGRRGHPRRCARTLRKRSHGRVKQRGTCRTIEREVLESVLVGVIEQHIKLVVATTTQHSAPVAALARLAAHQQHQPYGMLLGRIARKRGCDELKLLAACLGVVDDDQPRRLRVDQGLKRTLVGTGIKHPCNPPRPRGLLTQLHPQPRLAAAAPSADHARRERHARLRPRHKRLQQPVARGVRDHARPRAHQPRR
jgi:hypothetical protein